MQKTLQKFILRTVSTAKRAFFSVKLSKSSIIVFFFSFAFVFACLYITAQRGIAVKRIRASLPTIISSLNEFGIDIAYEDIKFNPMAFFPLMTLKSPQLYSLDEGNYWKVQFDEIKAYVDIAGSPHMQLEASSKGEIVIDATANATTNQKAFADINYNTDKKSITVQVEGFNIKNLALIKNLDFAINPSMITEQTKGIPSYTLKLNVKDTTINGLVNYPLSSHINSINIKSDIIGNFVFNRDFLTSIESWVKDGGFIDISQLVVQWPPLTLVGRGNLNFKKDLQPEITFNTSSKGLLKLLKGLQEISFLNNSNVYVANILLSNKAFRLNPADEEMTIITPIKYSDGKISIENLVIKDFDKDIQQ